MTLSMDPDSRDALVGKVVSHGQAYRAVSTNDQRKKKRKKKGKKNKNKAEVDCSPCSVSKRLNVADKATECPRPRLVLCGGKYDETNW